jgi:NADH dehydrogenase (ubiquinone) Fe-S protein 5
LEYTPRTGDNDTTNTLLTETRHNAAKGALILPDIRAIPTAIPRPPPIALTLPHPNSNTILILHLTGPGRCFPFWQEVLACYVTNTNAEDNSGASKCQPILEDYYECLHHKKEVRHRFLLLTFSILSIGRHYSPRHASKLDVSHKMIMRNTHAFLQAARTLALQAAYRKAEANIKRDDAPSAGEIRRLGVLDAPLEEKNLKPSKWFPHKEIN